MPFRYMPFELILGPVSTSSTSTITLGTFDTSNLPNNNGRTLDDAGAVQVTSRIYMVSDGGDHNSRMWERLSLLTFRGGAGLLLKGTANGNSNAGGLLGDANSSTIAFDISGTSWRCRITPDAVTSYRWFAWHRAEAIQWQ